MKFIAASKPLPPPPVAPIEVAPKDPEAVPEEVAKEVIQKAKVEDDEYKNQTGEQSYYGIAHTIREEVTEQASIMVNGKLKEYQIKVIRSRNSPFKRYISAMVARGDK